MRDADTDDRLEWAREVLADVLAIERVVTDLLSPMLDGETSRRGPGDGPTCAEAQFAERHAQLVDRCLRRAGTLAEIIDGDDEGADDDDRPAPPRSPAGKFSVVTPKPGDLL